MCLCLLKISMLEELLDSLRLIDFGICLVIEGGWFEEVCIGRSLNSMNYIYIYISNIYLLYTYIYKLADCGR